MNLRGWTAGVVALMLPELALATATSSDPARTESLLPGSGSLGQLTVGLVIVLVAAVSLTWLLRRYALPGNSIIQIIGGVPLGSRERLLLIEVDQVRLLIGVTSSHIQALHVFLPQTPVPKSPAMTPFRVLTDPHQPETPPHGRSES